MAKIIQFEDAKLVHEEWSEDLKALEWWVYSVAVAMTWIGSNRKYTKEQMLDCMCALTGLHNHIAKQLKTLEVYEVRKRECQLK